MAGAARAETGWSGVVDSGPGLSIWNGIEGKTTGGLCMSKSLWYVDWSNPEYLLHGNERQRAAYRALSELNIFHVLQEYDPLLVGTIPLGIDLPESDLDVICETAQQDDFAGCLERNFNSHTGFVLKRKLINSLPSIIANFEQSGFAVEIFGQPRPVKQQTAYRHLLVEAQLLEIGGESARREIVRLKYNGMKTEPAFARYFNLPEDPYQILLELSWMEHAELAAFVRHYWNSTAAEGGS